MKTGIITIKDLGIADRIQAEFPDWVVVVSPNGKEEINYYPTPNI